MEFLQFRLRENNIIFYHLNRSYSRVDIFMKINYDELFMSNA